MIDPFNHFIYLNQKNISMSFQAIRELSNEYINYPQLVEKSISTFDLLSQNASKPIIIVRYDIQNQLEKIKRSGEGDLRTPATPIYELEDSKKATFQLLTIAENLRKMVDWSYYESIGTGDSLFIQNVRDYINEIIDHDKLGWEEPFDYSRHVLKYYKIFDKISRKGYSRKSRLYAHLYFINALLQEAYKHIGKNESIELQVNRIQHSLQFSPIYYNAGMEILNHFAIIVRTKYPDMNVKIRIEQIGVVVRLIIDTPDGKRDIIEKELNDYMEVVAGRKKVDEYLIDPVAQMELRHSLQIADLKISSQRDMILLAAKTIEEKNERIKLLEAKEEKFLALSNSILDHERNETGKWRDALIKIMESSSSEVRSALLIIDNFVQNGNVENESEFRNAVQVIKADSPGLLDHLNDLLIKGAIQGVAGNSLYSYFQHLCGILPRI